ncbi:MAG TPA: zinc-ribbon domain-containing protein [Candidatus Limnocylindrales bacterium]|nr:zinc-ribbon domain-containing protein [Candidatus Limnocylindrales bacterium]
MTEPASPTPPAGATDRICPWCSAANPSDATTCHACGAALVEQQPGEDIPGVTVVDPGAVAAAAQADAKMLIRPTSRDVAVETFLDEISDGKL